MDPRARLETILGKLKQSLAGRTVTDKCVQSEHYGENYSISDVLISPKGRLHLQVTYDDGARMPILLDNHSGDIVSTRSKPNPEEYIPCESCGGDALRYGAGYKCHNCGHSKNMS